MSRWNKLYTEKALGSQLLLLLLNNITRLLTIKCHSGRHQPQPYLDIRIVHNTTDKFDRSETINQTLVLKGEVLN